MHNQAWDAREPEEILGPLNDVEQRNAPNELYVEGDVTLLQRSPRVAIVGARKVSSDGRKRTRRLARELVSNQVIIVSGLATGVDTEAHTTAMKEGGRTIAVIGTGLDQWFPPENEELQREIAREHLVVSQFAPGSPVQRSNFPRRNRTMALIADASVIVEAGDSSGSLSQGWEALRLGRPLFILRSLAESKTLSWPQEMMDYGAMVLTETDDLLPVLPADHVRSELIAI